MSFETMLMMFSLLSVVFPSFVCFDDSQRTLNIAAAQSVKRIAYLRHFLRLGHFIRNAYPDRLRCYPYHLPQLIVGSIFNISTVFLLSFNLNSLSFTLSIRFVARRCE